MTPKEMIEVILAFERGERIEKRQYGITQWESAPGPLWNFGKFEYRVAKPAPKKVKLYAYLDDDGYVRMVKHARAISVVVTNRPLIYLPHLDCEVEES